MKKLLLITITLCLCLLFASIPRAYAVSTYDYASDWTYEENGSNPDYMLWTSDNINYLEFATSFSFSWPNLIINPPGYYENGAWASQITFIYDGGTLIVPMEDLFISYNTSTALYSFSFSTRNQFFYTGGNPVVLSGLDSISFRIVFTEPAANISLHTSTWLDGSTMLGYFESFNLRFYDRGTLFYQDTVYDLASGIYVPEVTEPEGKYFTGWAFDSVSYLDLESPIIDSSFYNSQTNSYNLYAQYSDSPFSDSTTIEPVITDRIPDFMETLMIDYNMNTDSGYIGFYVITLIIIEVMLSIALIRVRTRTKEISMYITFLFYSLFWVYIGALPIWTVVIIIGLIIIGALLLVKDGVSSEIPEEETE